jgi:nucleoside-diphosphate-sugar epimerase
VAQPRLFREDATEEQSRRLSLRMNDFVPHTFFSNRSVLITGATGFIGSHLAERLVAEGACVRVLVRDPQKLIPALRDQAEVARGDLLQPDGFAAATRDCELVFHIAAWLGQPNRREAAYAINVTATQQLAEAARATGARRFISTSSVAVYGPVLNGIVDETWPHSDVYLYSETKSLGEQAVFAAQTDRFEVTVIRPSQVYGPRGGSWTTLPVDLAKRGLPSLIGGGHGFAHPVYVANLVDAYLLAAQCDEAIGEAFTICDTDVPWREFYGRYAAMAGKHARSVPVWLARYAAFGAELGAKIMRRPPAYSRAMLGFMTGRCVYSTDKARRLLGWSPRFSLDEGLRQTEIWLRETGMIN